MQAHAIFHIMPPKSASLSITVALCQFASSPYCQLVNRIKASELWGNSKQAVISKQSTVNIKGLQDALMSVFESDLWILWITGVA